MTTTLNVLLVEDNEDDAELVSLALRRGNFQPSVQRVSSAKALTAALEARAWDVILCDYSLPGFGGEEALRVVRDTVGWDVPVIFVSGHIGEEAAVELMQAGAQDFVNKNKLARLPGAIKRELDAWGLRIEKRRTDAMLDEERSLLRQLMTSIPDAIYFKDTQLRYTRLNDAEWRALNATGEAEVVGAAAEQFLPPNRARARREQEEDVVVNGRTVVDSVEQVKQADGTVRWFAATNAPIRDRDGKITGLVGISRDITERKFNEQLKDEFIATVSHELRTPLTSIAGSLSLLAGGAVGGLSDAALRLLKIAHANCQRMIRLTSDILDMERIRTDTVGAVHEPVELRPLVEQAIEANHGFAESHGVAVRLEAGDEQGVVLADRHRLIQILTNLLSNAVKFSPRGTETVVTIAGNDAELSVSIRDHGPGIPESFRDSIFDRFVQVDASDSREKGGAGLGLSIVKQLVLCLGGKVDFAPAPGGGTIFQVVLPRLKSPVAPEAEATVAHAAATVRRLS